MDTVALAPQSATIGSPKLLKKPSLADIRTGSSGEKKAYGCEHVRDLLDQASDNATKQYSRLVQSINKDNNAAVHLPKSSAVGAVFSLRPTWLCLQCPNVASTESRDAHDKSHKFCAESSTGLLYCRACSNIIYDQTFDDIRSMSGRKRTFSTFLSDVDNKILAANSTPIPCRALGLRGMYNMGQTCFMSVVLQSLIHNPFIRAYYLAESHKSADCERDCCTSCALDDIFAEFHSQEKAEGYGMVAMLQSSWRGGGSLAGYQQQDAHEYLQFILNSLHSANIDQDDKGSEEKAAEACDCIIHRTFCGVLQSTVTCARCKNVTTARDPFMDLSLDVRQPRDGQTGKKKENKISMSIGSKDKEGKAEKKGGGADGQGASPSSGPPPTTLTDCLDRFTSPETLPATDYTCRKCDNGAAAATKRLGLARLPPVLPIHLKRFSHAKASGASVKLDAKVRFPMTVDLAPYVTGRDAAAASPAAAKKKGEAADGGDGGADADGISATNGTGPGTGPRLKPLYDLSCVIVHKGKMDSGHYISYSRVYDEWFLFDDSKVVLVDENEVLSCEAYMLFYIVRAVDV